MSVRRAGCALLLVAAAATAGCERRDGEPRDAEPRLALTVETPEALDWGATGVLRVSLANEGDVTAEGGLVEVYVPNWLEFGTVEPPGTEVSVTSGDQETRLVYQFADSLPPGERRTVLQHLRVLYVPPPPGVVNDTIETVQVAPLNQVIRARLLTAAGEPAGAEVQASLHFVGGSAAGPRPLPALPDTMLRDTLLRDTMATDTLPPDTARRDG